MASRKKILPGFLREKTSGTDLYGYMVREAVDFRPPEVDDAEKFARVLTTPVPMDPVSVADLLPPIGTSVTEDSILTVEEQLAKFMELKNKPSKFTFFGRIESIHGKTLPEPSALTYSESPEGTLNLIKQHTMFISHVGSELPAAGDLVQVRLKKGDNGWNLQTGEYIGIFERGVYLDLAGIAAEVDKKKAEEEASLRAFTAAGLESMFAEYEEEPFELGAVACAALEKVDPDMARANGCPAAAPPVPEMPPAIDGPLGFWDTMPGGEKYFRYYKSMELLDLSVRPDFQAFFNELTDLGYVGVWPGPAEYGPMAVNGGVCKTQGCQGDEDHENGKYNQREQNFSMLTSVRRSVKHQWGLKTGKLSGLTPASPCGSDHQYGFAVDMNALRYQTKSGCKKSRLVDCLDFGPGMQIPNSQGSAQKDSPESIWTPIVKVAKKHNLTWQGMTDPVHFYHNTAREKVEMVRKKCRAYYDTKYSTTYTDWPGDFIDEVVWTEMPADAAAIANAKAAASGVNSDIEAAYADAGAVVSDPQDESA